MRPTAVRLSTRMTRYAILGGTGKMGAPLLDNVLAHARKHPDKARVTGMLVEHQQYNDVWQRWMGTDDNATRQMHVLDASKYDDLRQLVENADVLLSVLPRSSITRTFAERVTLPYAPSEQRRWVDLCSSDPKDTEHIATTLRRVGIGYVDAPVSGGTKGMSNKALSCVVSGEKRTVDLCREDVFPLFANKVQYVGDKVGTASRLKLANNTLLAANLLSVSAVLRVLRCQGIAEDDAIVFLNSASGRSWVTQQRYPDHILPETHDYGFSLELHAKDVLAFMNDAEHTLDNSSPLLEAVKTAYVGQVGCGDGVDHTEIGGRV